MKNDKLHTVANLLALVACLLMLCIILSTMNVGPVSSREIILGVMVSTFIISPYIAMLIIIYYHKRNTLLQVIDIISIIVIISYGVTKWFNILSMKSDAQSPIALAIIPVKQLGYIFIIYSVISTIRFVVELVHDIKRK